MWGLTRSALVAGIAIALVGVALFRAPVAPAADEKTVAARELVAGVIGEKGFLLSARQVEILVEGVLLRRLASREAVSAAATEMASFPFDDPLRAVFPERVIYTASMRISDGVTWIQ